jgi:hypothetical protein
MRNHVIGTAAIMALAAAVGFGSAEAASPAAATTAAQAGTCKAGFDLVAATNARRQAHDHNGNGFVCVKRNAGPGRNAVKDDAL